MPTRSPMLSECLENQEDNTLHPISKTSTLISRNITVSGRRTSVRLEQEMWNALKDIALREKCTIHDICSLIDMRKNQNTSLTAAIRVFLMLYYRAAATDDGHRRAGHGSFETMRQRARLRAEAQLYAPLTSSSSLPENNGTATAPQHPLRAIPTR